MAVTKCDLLDEELTDAMRPSLPEDLQVVFISSINGTRHNNTQGSALESINQLIMTELDRNHISFYQFS